MASTIEKPVTEEIKEAEQKKSTRHSQGPISFYFLLASHRL